MVHEKDWLFSSETYTCGLRVAGLLIDELQDYLIIDFR